VTKRRKTIAYPFVISAATAVTMMRTNFDGENPFHAAATDDFRGGKNYDDNNNNNKLYSHIDGLAVRLRSGSDGTTLDNNILRARLQQRYTL